MPLTAQPAWYSRQESMFNNGLSPPGAQKPSRRLFGRSSSIGIALSKVMPHRQHKSFNQSVTSQDHDLLKVTDRIEDEKSTGLTDTLVETSLNVQKSKKGHHLKQVSALPPHKYNIQLQRSDPIGASGILQTSSRKRHTIRKHFTNLWKPTKGLDSADKLSNPPNSDKDGELQFSAAIFPKKKISRGSLDIESHLKSQPFSQSIPEVEKARRHGGSSHYSPKCSITDYLSSRISRREISPSENPRAPGSPVQGVRVRQESPIVSIEQGQQKSSLKRRIDIKRLRDWREKRKSEKMEEEELEMELELHGLGGANLAEFERYIRSQSDIASSAPSTSSTINKSIFTYRNFPQPPTSGPTRSTTKASSFSKASLITPRSSSLGAPSFSNKQSHASQICQSETMIQPKSIRSLEPEPNPSSSKLSQPAESGQTPVLPKRSRLRASHKNNPNRRSTYTVNTQSLRQAHSLSQSFSDPGTPVGQKDRDSLPVQRRYSELLRSPKPEGPRPLPMARLPKVTNTASGPASRLAETPLSFTTALSLATPQSSSPPHWGPRDVFESVKNQSRHSRQGQSSRIIPRKQVSSKASGNGNNKVNAPSLRLFRRGTRGNKSEARRWSKSTNTCLSPQSSPAVTTRESNASINNHQLESSDRETAHPKSEPPSPLSDPTCRIINNSDKRVVEEAEIKEHHTGAFLQRHGSFEPSPGQGNIQELTHYREESPPSCIWWILEPLLDPTSDYGVVWKRRSIGWEDMALSLLPVIIRTCWIMTLIFVGKVVGYAFVGLCVIIMFMVVGPRR
ncbi:hypothetical protein F5884DRAFT_429525 [Xylogone sp. PMI_703]|nr:hypothetical protein F5884DRAFT_429525 [Xylogone sp. PMI_703]